MPIMRNPFRKNDENARPPPTINGLDKAPSTSSVNKFDVASDKEKEPVEYKLSGESGCALPRMQAAR